MGPIIAATVAGYAVAAAFKWFRDGVGPSASAYLALFAMAGFGLVGFLDDLIKLRRQRSLGLRARATFGGQLIIAVAFAVMFKNRRGLSPATTHLSYVRDLAIPLSALGFVAVAYLIFAAWNNAVNLSDGLDGLAPPARRR